MKLPLIISACLLGQNTKYNGKNNYNDAVKYLEEYFDFIPICPEVEGGLPVPRDPAEIIGDKVVSCMGKDVTLNYETGAQLALKKCIDNKAKYAVLKSKSPSCGKGLVYDGKFSGNLIENDGITARLLKENGINIFTEKEISLLINEIAKKS